LVYARGVDDQRALDDLVRLAERLGIEVRSRVLRGTPGSGSGLCRVRGQWVVILNSHSTLHEKRSVLGDAIEFVQRKDDPPERPGLAGLGPRGRRRGAP
jgi:hypothetical protein